MKYVDEFRNGRIARQIAQIIASETQTGRYYRLMEFCGGHTHTLSRYGIADLLPANIRMIHGPGCPVCVLPIGWINLAIDLSLKKNVILCTYADTLRIPAARSLSLSRIKAQGADIRVIYSVDNALEIARANPNCEVVFFAIGFETTTPPTAVAILQAAASNLNNFSVLCCHVLTPPAIQHILDAPDIRIDGVIGPGHVSTVIGLQAYEFCATQYQQPVVITGFEPLDIMQAILMLIRQINGQRAIVENEYTRAVTRAGNQKASELIKRVFEIRENFEWRGLGVLPNSAWQIRPSFAQYDAEQRFNLKYQPGVDHKGCECGAILRGLKHPRDCKLFARGCVPENPLGACMVSSEGACAAHYLYGRYRDV